MSQKTLFNDSHVEISTVVRAMDLIKVVNQIYNDNMACVRLTIVSCDNEDHDGEVKIAALPTMVSEDMKTYPTVSGLVTVEFPDEY